MSYENLRGDHGVWRTVAEVNRQTDWMRRYHHVNLIYIEINSVFKFTLLECQIIHSFRSSNPSITLTYLNFNPHSSQKHHLITHHPPSTPHITSSIHPETPRAHHPPASFLPYNPSLFSQQSLPTAPQLPNPSALAAKPTHPILLFNLRPSTTTTIHWSASRGTACLLFAFLFLLWGEGLCIAMIHAD